MNYPIVIAPLSEEDGGGFAGYAIDLPGCMSDGETPAEALENTQQAVLEWLEVTKQLGREVPLPGAGARRARERYNQFLAYLDHLGERAEAMDAQMEELRRQITDLHEYLQNEVSWTRFGEITGAVPMGVALARKTITAS